MPKTSRQLTVRVDPDLYKQFLAACRYYRINMREIPTRYMGAVVSDWREALEIEKRGREKDGQDTT